jgi:hypothetical protein
VGGVDEAELRDFLGWADGQGWGVGVHSWQWPDPASTPDPKLTILVTEGLGARPMNPAIFELLSAQDRQEALIEGVTRLRRPLRRPRVVIPLTRSSGAQMEPARPAVRPGATVRLLDHLHLGQSAQVRSLSSTPRRVGSRISVNAVEVVIKGEAPFWLPATCVEALS